MNRVRIEEPRDFGRDEGQGAVNVHGAEAIVHAGLRLEERRWILVTREKGIAASAGEGARWSVDHLIIDQDAVPTLAEVKRGSNPEIRRTIVGQLLEYAAHASETWTAEELRGMFERQSEARGRDAEAELAALLQTDGDPDVGGFWEDVSTNLAAKRLRLLFVADFIPDPLARVVEFLNAQMPNIEVLAVEIKRFHGTSAQTLVPRVMGRTAAAVAPGQGRSRQRLTRESFLDGFEDDDVRGVAERLLDAAVQSGADIYYGARYGVSIRARCSDWPRPITVTWLYSQPGKGWMRTRDFSFGAAVYDYEHPEEVRVMLERWVDEVSPPTVSPRTSRARASRHGLSGTRWEFSTRTFWWNVFNASSRSWRRCDGLREFGCGLWSRPPEIRSLGRHRQFTLAGNASICPPVVSLWQPSSSGRISQSGSSMAV